jgi:hypothetical protein
MSRLTGNSQTPWQLTSLALSRSGIIMKFFVFALLAACACLESCSVFTQTYRPSPPQTPPLAPEVRAIPQGSGWDDATRAAFYSLDQGSRLMPLTWFKALRSPDGQGFASDRLARWGYLPRPSEDDLPVGFTTGEWDGTRYVGMTCAACHTRQIQVGTQAIRIDGGPALTDLYGFFTSLDEALQYTLSTPATFDMFSLAVLPAGATAQDKAGLRQSFENLAGSYHAIASHGLKTAPAWGLGLADAVSMIFNRVAGLDIASPQDGLVITENIQPADAPVRYPFLWNAAMQDKTQWAAFAPNGNPVYALSRNLGEVYGVFGVVHPEQAPALPEKVNFIHTNSANFTNLERLEQLVERIGPPAWIWPTDSSLVSRGKVVFNEVHDDKGTTCAACHGVDRVWTFGFWPPVTINWRTPTVDVCTDSRQYDVLKRSGQSGALAGARLPLTGAHIDRSANFKDMLGITVAGAILQKAEGLPQRDRDPVALTAVTSVRDRVQVSSAFQVGPSQAPLTADLCNGHGPFQYEARVMEGIWAAAPYLHNGSVPTLADLLKPVDERPASFDISVQYDLDKVGLAATAPVGVTRWKYQTTGCDARASGRSRCGHEYGVSLPESDKRALLEYLKTL